LKKKNLESRSAIFDRGNGSIGLRGLTGAGGGEAQRAEVLLAKNSGAAVRPIWKSGTHDRKSAPHVVLRPQYGDVPGGFFRRRLRCLSAGQPHEFNGSRVFTSCFASFEVKSPTGNFKGSRSRLAVVMAIVVTFAHAK
jgi:hypothetical protein